MLRFSAMFRVVSQPNGPARFTVLRLSSNPRFCRLPMFWSDVPNPDVAGTDT